MSHIKLKNELANYSSNKLDLNHLINFVFNNKGEDVYNILGEYLVSKGFKDPYESFRNRESAYLTIVFLTSYLNEKKLEKMYGPGIKHSEFGEGFDRPRKYSMISYFLKINGYIFHIGIDHRGTSIECERRISNKDLIDCVKSIIDLYFEYE